ncbi:MAG: LuxR family transcriptional regulator, partial [Bacteroidia bacterium]|nr:LuxR family transcriptional regulator [Bacteroidia bacterium]
IYASASFEGMLYLGTNQGLFYKPISDETEFKIVPGTETQVWSLDVIDGQLFCGHNMGTFQIVDGQAKLINTVPGTWSVKKVPENSELLLQGNYQGLHTLIKNNGRWEPGNNLEGFDFSAKHFEIVDAKTILVSHEYRGVYKLKVNIP